MPKLLHRLLPAPLRRKVALWPHRHAVARLVEARRAPQAAQRKALESVVARNQHTEFGRTHGFSRVAGLSDFIAKVPLRSYRDLEPYLRRQLQADPTEGGAEVLFAGADQGCLLETQGGRRRYFPLSQEGLEQRLWAERLLEHEALSLRVHTSGAPWLEVLSFFDPSPQALVDLGGETEVHDDADPTRDLGEASSGLRQLTALPPRLHTARVQRANAPGAQRARKKGRPATLPEEVFSFADETQRFYLLLRLALETPYSVLRAPNPGTLLLLAEHLEEQAERLLDDLAEGVVSLRDELPEGSRGLVPARLKAQPQRAAQLREELAARGRLEPRHLWPDLGLLVCDCGGPAREAAERLPDRYGDLPVLDSGHVDGLGVLTLPTVGDEGGLALLEGQLLEFLPAGDDESAPTLPADGLRLGERYYPVVTNHDGLYRLLSDQLVEVTEIDAGTPRLARCGRREARLPLGEGELLEAQSRDALLAACRSLDTVVSGQAAWLEPPEAPREEDESEQEARPGFWARLFGRKDRKPAPRSEPALTWAVETERTLDETAAAKLCAAAEAELRRGCPAYAKERSEQRLAEAQLILLRPGTFTKHARRRLAEGRPGAHQPPPALREVPLRIDERDLERGTP